MSRRTDYEELKTALAQAPHRHQHQVLQGEGTKSESAKEGVQCQGRVLG